MPIQGGVTVELGDLMFYDDVDDLRNDGDSIASYAAFPISYFRPSTGPSGASLTVNRSSVTSHFLGVALDDTDGITNGPTINLSVATKGVFDFPLKPAGSIAAGDFFGASGSTIGSDMYDQYVRKVTDSKFALGRFTETKTSALTAEVTLKRFLNK